MQNSALTNSQSIGKELERLAIDYLRGDKWKKLVQLESSQISKPDSDQYDPLNLAGRSTNQLIGLIDELVFNYKKPEE